MPWVSKRQTRWGNSPAGHAALGDRAVAEWNAATRGMRLPARRAYGGYVPPGYAQFLQWADREYADGGGVPQQFAGGSDGAYREGFIASQIPGRTDKIAMRVAAGAFVVPADVVSSLGQGNSVAGAEILTQVFNSGQPQGRSGQGRDGVPIVAAGGEFLIAPEMVKAIGHGDLAKGHRILSKFVLHARREHIKELRQLKPPRR